VPSPVARPAPLALELAGLALVPLVLAWIVLTPGYSPDPDAGFHVGCAELYSTEGWIADFPWLGYTALAEGFPNVYLLQHLLLAPIARVLEPEPAVLLSTVLLGTALALSLWLVLLRWGVRWAAAWTVLGLLASPYSVAYLTSLKGGSTFYVLLPWFADAVWSRAARRTFLLAWLSVYVYVGASILVPMAVVFVVVLGLWEREWRWSLVGATAAGIAGGLLVNPFWPHHWEHTLRELGSVFLRTVPEVEAIRGGEWMQLEGKMIARIAGPMLAAWAAGLVLHLARGERAGSGAAAGAVVALGLFGGGLLGGAKILFLFLLVSAIFLPLLGRALRPWPRWAAVVALALALANAGWNVRARWLSRDRFPPPSEYRALARFLEQVTAEGELVLAPWDDFGSLFLFDRRNRYVAGFNVEFLHRTDPQRFRAYYLLYEGEVKEPARTLARHFEGARFVLTRRQPRRPGEEVLTRTLAADRAFDELGSPAQTWRVFRLRAPLRVELPGSSPEGERR
jgi:hypothetical protein